MKSKYYPDLEFMEATLGPRPSYGWRSILHGRDLLSQGMAKQIGNGESFQVWTDSWIEDNGWRPPLRKQTYFDLNLSVSDLIDVQRRGWNLEVVHDLFPLEDVRRITMIRPVVGREDFWSWDHTKSGNYTVKSGYWLANQIMKEELINVAECQPSLNEVKEKVWKLSTVPKIKAFLWRATNDALPVMDLLQIRGLDGDKRCQQCGMEGETINHALFTCSVARQTWALSRFPHPKDGFDDLSVHSNFFYLFTIGKKGNVPIEIRRLFPWILWRIWKNRNIFLFEGKVFHPLETQKKIEEEAEDWALAQIVEQEDEETKEQEEESKAKWETPPPCWIKCNIGVEWSKKKQVAGSAWIIRNEEGNVLLHSRRAFSGVETKGDAFLKTISWAVEAMNAHHFHHVIFAVEDAVLVGAVNRPRAWPSFAFQSAEILFLLEKVRQCEFVFEAVSAKKGASLMAQSASNHSNLHSYVAVGAPTWLEELFESERSFLYA